MVCVLNTVVPKVFLPCYLKTHSALQPPSVGYRFPAPCMHVEAETVAAEAVAMFAAPSAPLRRAVPEHDASGNSFFLRGARSTEDLKNYHIFPLMGDSTRDKGWVERGLNEPKHGCSRGDRRWKNHNYERHPLCGLRIWDP